MSLVHRMSTLIESMVEELQKTNDELRRVAVTDELTGLYNRREIERRIREAPVRACGVHRKIALVMLDIDFFKKVNDTYGHDYPGGPGALYGENRRQKPRDRTVQNTAKRPAGVSRGDT